MSMVDNTNNKSERELNIRAAVVFEMCFFHDSLVIHVFVISCIVDIS